MNTLLVTLDSWGDYSLRFAWPMLWQSSLLIGLLLGLEWALRRRVRAAVRYGLWLLVLLKLLLPPSLALPTGLGWWLRPAAEPPTKPPLTAIAVTYGPAAASSLPAVAAPVFVPPPRPRLSSAAGALVASATVSLWFLGWIIVRWRQAARDAERAGGAPDWLDELLQEARQAIGLRRRVRVRLIDKAVSPAVCGLFWPVVLLPKSLVERLPHGQLRAVLLHELAHLQRGDVWANCAQALLQVVYWWHPLLWLANARIRRLREEAVDDAVMVALREEAETYAPTLLEVARLALQRPLASLGLVGILESHSFLRQRIERLLEFRPPRKAGLTMASALCVLAFGAMALPMGEGPSRTNEALLAPAGNGQTGRAPLLVRVFKVDPTNSLKAIEQPLKPGQPAAPKLPSESFRALFQALGVDLTPPKSLFYKDRLGWLYVRATAEDLAIIEEVIDVLNAAPDTAHSTPSTGEAAPGDAQPFGFDWYLGDRLMNNASANARDRFALFFNGATNATNYGVLLWEEAEKALEPKNTSPSNPNLVEEARSEAAFGQANGAPPQIALKARFFDVPEEAAVKVWKSLGKDVGGTNLTSILTPAETTAVLDTIQSDPRTARLGVPSVTTLSGRQAQVSCLDLQTIVTNINPAALEGRPDEVQVTTIGLGPTLDLIPVLTTDDCSIQLTTVGTLTEFLGYDRPTNSPAVYADGKKRQVLKPLPHFRVRQTVNSATVWDGQTLLLGGPVAENIRKLKEKVPVLGDVPLLGRLFRSEFSVTEEKHLLVLITPTLIDPAGNRVHTDEEVEQSRKRRKQ